jgi:hypothetical protein
MSNFLTVLKAVIKWTPTIPDAFALEKLILTLKPSLPDLTPSTWTRTRKRCCKNAELVLLTLRERKLSERPERSSLKKLGEWLNYKNNVN